MEYCVFNTDLSAWFYVPRMQIYTITLLTISTRVRLTCKGGTNSIVNTVTPLRESFQTINSHYITVTFSRKFSQEMSRNWTVRVGYKLFTGSSLSGLITTPTNCFNKKAFLFRNYTPVVRWYNHLITTLRIPVKILYWNGPEDQLALLSYNTQCITLNNIILS